MGRPGTTVRLTALTVAGAYSIALHLSGVKLDNGLEHVLAYMPIACGVGLVAFDLWLWRLGIFYRFLAKPRLDGLWRVTLRPAKGSHIPEEGNWGPIEAYMCISQTYWGLAVRQYTAESTSDSCSTSITSRGDRQRYQVTFIYQNSPKQEHLARSPRHFGGCILDVTGRSPREITGLYFTDRFTRGDMELQLIDRGSAHPSFGAARDHSSARGSNGV